MTRRLFALILMLALCVSAAAVAESDDLDGGTVTIFLPAKDLSGLKAVQRRISLEDGYCEVYALLKELMQKPVEDGTIPLFGENARLTGIEYTFDVITVSIDTYSATDDRYRALSAVAIARTLIMNSEVKGINVLADSCAVTWEGASLNTMGRFTSDYLSFESVIKAALQSRCFTVYCPDVSGSALIPVLRMRSDNSSELRQLLRLIGEAGENDNMLCKWPSSFRLWDGFSGEASFNQNGRRVLSVSYAEPQDARIRISDAFAQTGMRQWQLIASLTLTLTTNLSVERVKIRLMDMDIVSVTGFDGETIGFENGEIMRSDFTSEIAGRIKALKQEDLGEGFYFEDKLIFTVDMLENKDLLLSSLDGILENNDVLRVVAPLKSGLYSEQNVRVSLSDEFYLKNQSLSAEEEGRLIYAIVNALCENIPYAKAVSFTVEGYGADTFAAEIRLDGELYPNPGIMKR